MKIAILNESFLTEAHLARLRTLGEVVVYENTTTLEQARERLTGVEVAVADCFLAPLNRELYDSVVGLKYLTLNSTSFESANPQDAKARGIQVANVPGFSTDSVSEQAIALMFAVVRHIVELDRRNHEKPYQIDPGDKSQLPFLGWNLRGKTMGVVGLGAIGTRVAELAQGLGMRVIAYNHSPKNVAGVQMVELPELLKQSDVVSLNVSFSADSEGMIGSKEFDLMKPSSVLISTVNHKIINEAAFVEALKNKKIAGAGLDGAADFSKDDPLFQMSNVVITPHSAFYTRESLDNLAEIVVKNIESYCAGSPINVVN